MEDLHQSDTIVSHRILNYLFAGYQGEFTYWRVLQELESSNASDESIQKVDVILQKVSSWYNGLFAGDCLFSAAWKMPETFDAKKAIKLLEALYGIAADAARDLREVASLSDWKTSNTKISIAIAHVTRNAQSACVYAQGTIDLAQIINDQPTLQNADAIIDPCRADAERAALCLAELTQSGAVPEEMMLTLSKDVESGIGTLAAQAHDIVLILSLYKGGEAFVAKTFEPQELDGWRASGISMFDAGYWRAYRFSPEDAQVWIDLGISMPGVAAMWRIEGFVPSEAAEWMNLGLTPAAGRKWRDAGHDLAEAMSYIKKGFLLPENLPQGE